MALWVTIRSVSKLSEQRRFQYDGDALVAEYDGNHNLLRRYVHGADGAADDPLVWYEGAGLGDRRYLHSDERGSITGIAGSDGRLRSINAYDEYGIPNATNTGRFQYTGQTWLPEIGIYYYKARIYSPTLGRFLQVDPIGYDDQINLYAYVANDPVNNVDPTGLETDEYSLGSLTVGISGNGVSASLTSAGSSASISISSSGVSASATMLSSNVSVSAHQIGCFRIGHWRERECRGIDNGKDV